MVLIPTKLQVLCIKEQKLLPLTIHDNKKPKSNVTTQKRHQNFDYTTIADRPRTDRWGNDSHPTGVIEPVYGIPTIPLTAKAV